MPTTAEGLPLLDLHVHPDKSTVDEIVALSRKQGVKYGMVEHAGTRENVYPRVLSNDEELLSWTGELDGKGVYKGVQAEWLDWSSCFSKKALATLDYVLTDTMTFPGPGGKRMKLWEKEAVIDDDAERFMDSYVDWHLKILNEQPIDLLANVSWLPAKFADRYETLWTRKRVETVVTAFVKQGIAMEISGSFILPKNAFPAHRQGGRREILFRIQRTIPQHGQTGLLAANGEGIGASARGHVAARRQRPARRALTRKSVQNGGGCCCRIPAKTASPGREMPIR